MKKIKLIRPHIHAGVSYSPGDELLVSDADAIFLVRYQIGVAVKTATKSANKTEKNATSATVAAITEDNTPSDNTNNPEGDK
jgi:hypothetical protein|nr:MAG TPA: hypothetical protein [Caudoviricetes sp.]